MNPHYILEDLGTRRIVTMVTFGFQRGAFN